ncbi:penicillin acylase family protein [Rubrivivax gelatinosus]|uniref:Penicillin amidase n=1 Tax=Rubrivivax gelatinosus TaxID=28068 RepID=A0A4R2MEB6_RUBGE|nr:penicillin acylase family protein [Rubrivivax gelatinosus]MBK1689000.1 penicillin amidase [Rubrivivax gelatinosus]TCP03027.1 penicillin amidase [Rubrivivax gelatinosus]
MRSWLRCAVLPLSAWLACVAPPALADDGSITVAGLRGPVSVVRDVDGVAHVRALSERDALFMQGWLHAEDRLFQADTLRRTASGTLAELVGASALAQDVQLRTIGLRRAAEKSLSAASPELRAGLEAYAAGVNAWVAAHALPAEYARLRLTQFSPWTPVDSLAIGKLMSFQLSFDFDTELTSAWLSYRQALGDDRVAQALFFGDVFRTAPFDPASTLTDAGAPLPWIGTDAVAAHPAAVPAALAPLLARQIERTKAVPLLERVMARRQHQIGSNEWAVSARLSADGRPLIANDPHLSLGLPSNLYDLHLVAADGLDAIGSGFPGVPWIVLGQNRRVAWGSTTTHYDVTDAYAERVVPASTASGLASVYQGRNEAIVPIPITFKVNALDPSRTDALDTVPPSAEVPPYVLLVPRHGPVVQLDTAAGSAITIQWIGAGATRELDAYRLLNRAASLEDVRAALQYFDVGSQNFVVGDVDGRMAWFTSGEVPLREDLQAGTLAGAPPYLVRNGQGGNEWLKKASPGPTDASGYETLPYAEMPQLIDPPEGFFVNANNDPAALTLDNDPLNQRRLGGGLYYLGPGYDFGPRAGRITQRLRAAIAAGPVTRREMASIQADTVLVDAQVFVPMLLRAYDGARAGGAPAALQALAADARVAEAAERLRRWGFDTPTGLDTGYDASDFNGQRRPPTQREIDASVAATIHAVWRGQAVALGLDRTLAAHGLPQPGSLETLKSLRHLMERDGLGLSGVDFFAWTGLADASQRRDYVLLKALQDALDLLSGPAFERAFARSTNQADWRWGKLHRIVLRAVFADASIPGATPGFEPSVAGLPGLAVDGGLGTVDVANHGVRAADDGAFMFSSGPNRRYVGAPGPGGIPARSILPGGQSGVLGSEHYASFLARWLTNETYAFRVTAAEIQGAAVSRTLYRPAR